ncbi:MAG: ribosome biogenesis GTPase YlqF [Rhodocyclaceae bacterium]|nr:ribosome biogenesis GTPase YlqF [Rhodocyclaceae bacterium]
MAIQWFPGHMNAARKEVAESLARIDVVIEVCDARCPEASRNPLIERLREVRQRPALRVLNKADLADPAITAAWLEAYGREPGVAAIAISAKEPGEVAKLPHLCRRLAPHRNDATKPLRLMILGIPNVGKSTLLNALLRRRIAAVGDEPAVTKHQQRYDLAPDVSILDTPGLMWPKIEHDCDGYMLAACHAIGKNAVIEEEVAMFLADILLERYPARLASRYEIDPHALDAVGLLEAVARRRGCLRKGELDLEKASLVLLKDFRSGALGRISLETPKTRAALLAQGV